MSKQIIMMVGLPGTGKSTIVANIREYYKFLTDDYVVLSTDDEIEKMAKELGKTYSESFNDLIKIATKTMNQKKQIALTSGVDVVWDQTNLTSKSRCSKIKDFLDKGYSVHACLVTCDISEILSRLRYRAVETGKVITEDLVERMINTYEEPFKGEGFQTITHIRTGH